MSDTQLSDALYKKYYSNIPRDQFNKQIGLGAEQKKGGDQATAAKSAQGGKTSVGPQSAPGSTVRQAAMAPVEGLKSIQQEAVKEGQQNYEDIKGDITAPVKGKGGKPPGVMDYLARGGNTALDVGARPFIYPRAAVRQTLGRSAQEASGGYYDPDTVADFALFVAPLAKSNLVKGAVTGTADTLEKIFSPTTVSKSAGKTEGIIRKSSGTMNLAHEKAAANLMEHNKLVGNLPVPEQRQMISDMENGRPQTNPKLQKAADAIGNVYEGWKTKIKQTLRPQDVPNFINDYYAHIWKDKPNIVANKMGAYYRQGSGRNFKARSIPTIEDGIKAGLTPKYENPIESTLAYSQNMSRYVATHDMLNELKTQGYAKWYGPGSKNIPQGWVPLNGILSKKLAPGAKALVPGSNTGKAVRELARPIQLYAPENVARVYNNFISKGFADNQDWAPVYETARKAANGMTMMKLGLSTYHLGTMANEAMISDYARAFRAASKGEFKTAAKAFVKAPLAPVTSYQRGMKMQRELLDKAMPSAVSKQVNDAFVRVGQTIHMDPFYRTRASGSFFNAWQKGTFKRELKDAVSKLYTGTALEKAKGTADLVANVIQTTAAPLFEHYIPAVKRGAFASEMEDFLKANPKATQAQIDAEALKVADSIDNRFGELNRDNLFWSQKMKQAAQLALLAPTWDLGTVREIAGGLKDLGSIPKEGLSRRSAYVAGLAFQTAMVSSIYQYLKTGKAPQSAHDLMTPRTGGKDVISGKPERAITPGYQKDVYSFGYDFPYHVLDTAANKLNPMLTTGMQLFQNKDYRGLPIMPPHGVKAQPGQSGLGDFLVDQFMPITMEQFKQGAMKGSNIGGAERAFNIRPAPQYMTDPERQQRLQKKYGTQDWRRKVKADARQESRQQ